MKRSRQRIYGCRYSQGIRYSSISRDRIVYMWVELNIYESIENTIKNDEFTVEQMKDIQQVDKDIEELFNTNNMRYTQYL